MTIDTSQLDPEKQAFLKANPDVLKSIEQAIPLQAKRVQTRRERVQRGKAEWQQKVDDTEREVEELKRKYDPILMELERNYEASLEKVKVKDLVCPVCGEGDRGNVMNDRPWCFKCNTPLLPKGKVQDFIKVIPKGSKKFWGIE